MLGLISLSFFFRNYVIIDTALNNRLNTLFNPLRPDGPYLDYRLWLKKILSKIKKYKNLIIDSKLSKNFKFWALKG